MSQLLNSLELVILIVAAIVLGPMVLAWLRNPVVGGIGHLVRLIIVGLASVTNALAEARNTLRNVAEGALDGLAYQRRHTDFDDEPAGYRGWNVIGPLVYLAAVVVITIGDYDLMSLRLAALFGIPAVSPLPLSLLGLFLGLLWLATVAVYASVIFDLHGLSPISRPFHNASPRVAHALRILVWAGVVLSLVSGGVLWYVGSVSATGGSTGFAVLFLILFAILMNGALVLASWSIHPALVALFFLAVSVLRVVAWLVERVLMLVMRLLDALARLIVAVIDIPARLGRKMHNYFCNFSWLQRIYWRPWPEFAELPSLLPENLAEENVLLSLGSDDALGLPRVTVSEERARRLGAGRLALPAARHSTIVVGFGPLGAQMMDCLWPTLRASAAQGGILAVGEYNDETMQRSQAFVMPSVTDISPTAGELAAARAQELSDETIRQRIMTGMVQRVIALLIGVAASGGQVVIVADAKDIDQSVASALAELHRRRQEQEIIVVACHQTGTQDPARAAEANALLATLCGEHTLQAVISVECAHPDAIRSASVALASLMSARTLTLDNPSFADVLGRTAPETGHLSIQCAHDIVASVPDVPSRMLARSRPVADLQDCVIQTRHAAQTALTTLSTQHPPLATQQLAFVITAPLRPGTAAWEQFRVDMEAWLSTQRPSGVSDLLVVMPSRALETHVAILFPQTPQKRVDEGESDEMLDDVPGFTHASKVVDGEVVSATSTVYRSNGTH